MTKWQTPYTFPNGTAVRNRLIFAPVSTMSSNRLGQLSQTEMAFYEARSYQVGLMILGSATISPSGKAYENNVSIANDALIPNLRAYNRRIKANGAKSIIQLYHGGQAIEYLPQHKKVPVVSDGDGSRYITLTDQDIQKIIADFGKAIVRAIKADFDGVEIHAGNPFLIQSFLSPRTNHRQDYWGERTTFLEVLVRLALKLRAQLAPSFVIGVRLAMEEKGEGGMRLSDTAALVSHISKLDVDYVHFNHDYIQADLAGLKQLQDAAGRIPVVGNGGLKSEQQLEEVLAFVPLISAARPIILNSNFPFEGEAGTYPKGLQASITSSPDWYFN